MRLKVVSSKKVIKADHTPHLVKVDPKDKKRVLASKSSDFETATGSFIWASNKGLKKLNISGIKHEVVSDTVKATTKAKPAKRIMAATNYDTKVIAKWLKAKFDDEAFGTAYTTHRISDGNAYMGRNSLAYNSKNNTIEVWKGGGDNNIPVFKVIPQYSSTKKQGTYAPKLPKLVPIDEWNATHNVESSKKIRSSKSIKAARTPKTREQTILQANYYDGSGWYDCGSLDSGYTVWSDDYKAVRKLREEYKKSKSNPNDPGSYRLITRRVPNPDYVEPNPDMVTDMKPYELRDNYYAKHPDGHFFDPETLKFFGERWSDMKISHDLVEIKDYRGNPHICYELVTKQRNAPGGTKTSYHYFDRDTFDEILV